MGTLRTHMEPMLVNVASAAVIKEIKMTKILTGMTITPKPKGRCFKNSHNAMIAPPSFNVLIRSAVPFICMCSALPPQMLNQTRPKTEGRIQLTIMYSRTVLPYEIIARKIPVTGA